MLSIQPTIRHLLTIFFAIGLAIVATACGGTQDAEDETANVLPERQRYGTLEYSAYVRESSDIDLDGRPDQFTYRDENGLLLWSERDVDFDGRLDFFEYYDEVGGVVEQELQLDFDDAIDVVRYFRGGVLVRKELSTGYSGAFGIVKFYDASGQLLRVERDRDDDSQIDVWEYYEDGEVARIGRDENGDGTPESIVDVD